MRERQLMYGGIQNVIASASTGTHYWPANDPDFLGAEWVEFMFYLSAIGGNPTTATLEAKFQKGMASTTATEYAVPVWQDFEDIDVETRCAGGLAWGYQPPAGPSYPRSNDHTAALVHEKALTASLGYFITCRVEKPFGKMRVALIPTFTGGEEGETNNYQVIGLYELERG